MGEFVAWSLKTIYNFREINWNIKQNEVIDKIIPIELEVFHTVPKHWVWSLCQDDQVVPRVTSVYILYFVIVQYVWPGIQEWKTQYRYLLTESKQWFWLIFIFSLLDSLVFFHSNLLINIRSVHVWLFFSDFQVWRNTFWIGCSLYH